MIKTFNINLAGQIFNINEDAYEHLSGYFNSLRTFYANEDDKDEIIRDIEARFAELFPPEDCRPLGCPAHQCF